MTGAGIVIAVLLVPVILLAFARRWGQWFPWLERRAGAVDAKLAGAVHLLRRGRRGQEEDAGAG